MLKIREIRKQRKMTMKQLGDIVGVTESAIGHYETGKREPSYELLRKISKALDCRVADLFEADENSLPVISQEGLEAIEYIANIDIEFIKDHADLILDYRDASEEIREEVAAMLHRSAERKRKGD